MSQDSTSEGDQGESREPLFVPVREGEQWLVIRMYRTPLGERTAVAFTSRERLEATLGADQPWTRLGQPALVEVAAARQVSLVTVDPTLSAPLPQPLPSTGSGTGLCWNIPLEVRA